MGYHTHFYAYDKDKQVEWAKEILARYKERLQKNLDKLPEDKVFKLIYESTIGMVTDEKVKEFYENAKKYDWPQWCIDDNEAFFTKYRDPNYSWEVEKQEYIDRYEKLKETGLLDLKFDGDFALDYVAFLIDNWKNFKCLEEYGDPDYETHDGKLYSGEILKCHYCVKGRYCQSRWFNCNGVIEMIEDYVDVTKKTKTGRNPKLKLSKEEKHKIERFFRDYPDSYCWII